MNERKCAYMCNKQYIYLKSTVFALVFCNDNTHVPNKHGVCIYAKETSAKEARIVKQKEFKEPIKIIKYNIDIAECEKED